MPFKVVQTIWDFHAKSFDYHFFGTQFHSFYYLLSEKLRKKISNVATKIFK